MPECHVLFLMDLMIAKPFSFKFCCIVSIFLGICAIFLHKKCVVLRKSACPLGRVKTKMYLPESPFFKNSLAGRSGLVCLSDFVLVLRAVFIFKNHIGYVGSLFHLKVLVVGVFVVLNVMFFGS